MLDWSIGLVAPHICNSCGEVGDILCESCEYDIVEEGFSNCVNCLAPCVGQNLCRTCRARLAYKAAYVVSWRREGLKRLINSYKFERAKAASTKLARLVDKRLPILDQAIVVSYIPTVSANIRHRGHDHMRLIAKHLACQRGWQLVETLDRLTSDVQHGASHQQRQVQAKVAFGVRDIELEGPLLLLDDIFTTGATIKQATKLLRAKHHQPITVAIIARQPKDD